MFRLINKALHVFRRDGFSTAAFQARVWLKNARFGPVYRRWLTKYDPLSDVDLAGIAERIAALADPPLISILMPVYNVDEMWLRRAIDSVRQQIYPHWELCIADDNSPSPHIRRVLDEYMAADKRIKVAYRTENGHISAASNSALELVSGDFTALMDHDDELAVDALYHVAVEIDRHPACDVIYTDEDKIDTKGRRFHPNFKPDWSPDLLCSMNLVTHLLVYRTSILRGVGGFRVGFEGSQDFDLALRITGSVPHENIRHIPRVLYHWRTIAGSVALSSEQKPYAHDRARTAITEHLATRGIKATAVRGYGELHRVIFERPASPPSVSFIVFIDNQPAEPLIKMIASAATDIPFEIIAVTASGSPIAGVRSVVRSEGGIFAAFNAATSLAASDLLLFLDGTTVSISAEAIAEMASYAGLDGVGAVGAKVTTPERKIKHAGYVLGIRGGVGRSHFGSDARYIGNYFRLVSVQNPSAISVDAMMIRRELFAQMGGFDAEAFSEAFADVDLCLRLKSEGSRTVWTPWANITQQVGAETAHPEQLDKLKAKWAAFFANDPHYNPNLSLESESFAIADPPRLPRI